MLLSLRRHVPTAMTEIDRLTSSRVLLRRESVWSYASVSDDEPGILLETFYVAYSVVRDLDDFVDTVGPVLATLRLTSPNITAGFMVRAESFQASVLRQCVERCVTMGVSTLVELRGAWPASSLQLLGAVRPTWLRISPEHVQEATELPDQHRALVRVADFASRAGVPLIARGVPSREARAALCSAGVVLFNAPESGMPDDDPLAALGALGEEPNAAELRFPLRPAGER